MDPNISSSCNPFTSFGNITNPLNYLDILSENDNLFNISSSYCNYESLQDCHNKTNDMDQEPSAYSEFEMHDQERTAFNGNLYQENQSLIPLTPISNTNEYDTNNSTNLQNICKELIMDSDVSNVPNFSKSVIDFSSNTLPPETSYNAYSAFEKMNDNSMKSDFIDDTNLEDNFKACWGISSNFDLDSLFSDDDDDDKKLLKSDTGVKMEGNNPAPYTNDLDFILNSEEINSNTVKNGTNLNINLNSVSQRTKSCEENKDFISNGNESNDDENFDDLFDSALLQEPKINHKIMQKIKTRSLIDLRRVKYNSKMENSSSETICFATQSAVKKKFKKSCKKTHTKTSVNKDNPLVTQIPPKQASESEILQSNLITSGSFMLPVTSAPCQVSFPIIACISKPTYLPLSNEQLKLLNSIPSANSVSPAAKTSSFFSTTKEKDNCINPLPSQKLHKETAPNMNNEVFSSQKNRNNNNLINLKNVVKIEIYTKPPKKMVLTKCNKQRLFTPVNVNEPLQENCVIKSNLSKLMNSIKEKFPNISDELKKKINIPLSAVKRSYLTMEEMICVKKQVKLLQLIQDLKNASHFCNHHSCIICKDISEKEHELKNLCERNYLKAIPHDTHPPTNNKFGGVNADFKQTETNCKNEKSVKQKNELPEEAHKEFDEGNSNMQDISSSAECEIRNEDLTLYINESGSEYISRRPHQFIEKPFSTFEKSKHWKRALQYKHLSNLMKNYIDSLRCDAENSFGCGCIDNCRSFLRCSCASKVLVCTDCSCDPCENPFFVLQTFSIDLMAVKADSCLLQAVYDIGVIDLAVLLNEESITPCCQQVVQLHQIIPNVVECPHCRSFLSYSWCHMIIRSEQTSQRNHCSVCGKCQPFLYSHCYFCEVCTVTSVNGKCIECCEEKLYTGTTLG